MSLSTIDTRQMVTYPGAVLQVVYANNTTNTITISTSTNVTLVTANITPISPTIKVLVLATIAAVGKPSTNAEGFFFIARNGSSIVTMDGITPYSGSTALISSGSVSGEFLDSPGTTSSISYTLMGRDDSGVGLKINWEGGCTSLTLMEIAG